jgi:hypothetical protein
LPEREEHEIVSLEEQTRARRLLLLVGIGYLVAQLATVEPGRYFGWDEAIYVAEARGIHGIPFSETRARGIVFSIIPATFLGASVAGIRLYLMALTSVALVWAFGTWVPLIGSAAPLAAGFVAFSWLGLFYGSAIFPNLLLALCAVAAAGYVTRFVAGAGTPRSLPAAGTAIALVAAFRPMESLWLFAGLVAFLFVVLDRRAILHCVSWLAAGLVAGWLPWVVESFAAFGNPVARMRQSVSLANGFGIHVLEYLRLADGPLFGSPGRLGPVPLRGALWLGVLLALALVGMLAGRRLHPGVHLGAPIAGALALAAPYLFLVGITNPRFLLPVYALASIPAAVGLRVLGRNVIAKGAVGMPALVALVFVLGATGIWHIQVARAHDTEQTRLGNAALELAMVVRQRAAGQPCAFASQTGFPQIELASGCEGDAFVSPRGDPFVWLTRLHAQGRRVFILTRSARPDSPLLADWRATPLSLRWRSGWILYEPPEQV